MSTFKDILSDNITANEALNIPKNDSLFNLLTGTYILGIAVYTVRSPIMGIGTNTYAKGKFNLHKEYGQKFTQLSTLESQHKSEGGCQLLDDGVYLGFGIGLFADGIVEGDQMHVCYAVDPGGSGRPGGYNMELEIHDLWHGQCRVTGPWDCCSVTPNIIELYKWDIIWPWVKCEQGFNSSSPQLQDYSSRFIIIKLL